MVPETDDDLLREERDIRNRLAGQPFDFDAAQAIQNIYRAAAAIRRRAEREMLADRGLTWGGFTILWVLWVWGAMDASTLAAECDLSKGTVTGMVSTLERNGLVERSRSEQDRRRVAVGLTPEGEATIADLYPRFNELERTLVGDLDTADQRHLAGALRRIITRADT